MIEKSSSKSFESSTPSQDTERDKVPSETSFDITLQYDSVREFIRKASPLVSSDGMFLPTDSPAAVGSVVSFQMLVGDDFNLGKGTGVVAWRGRYQGTDEETSGIAISFKDIDSSTRGLVQRVVDRWSKTDGAPFRLDHQGAGSQGAAPDDSPVPESLAAIDQAADPLDHAQGAASEIVPESSEPTPGLEALLGGKDSKLRRLVEQSVQGANDIASVDDDPDGDETAAKAPPSPQPTVEAIEAVDMPDRDEIFEYDKTVFDEEIDSKGQTAGNRRKYFIALAVVLLLLFAAGLFFKSEVMQFIESLESRQNSSPPGPALTQPEEILSEAGEETGLGSEIQSESETTSLEVSPIASSVNSLGLDTAVDAESSDRQTGALPEPESNSPLRDKDSGQTASENLEVLTGVRKISFEILQGQTVISIHGYGTWGSESYKVYRVGDRSRPRQLVKIYGIRNPFSPNRMNIGSEQVHRVRIGHHPEFDPPELHVVADLANIGVELVDVSAIGSKLELRLVDR